MRCRRRLFIAAAIAAFAMMPIQLLHGGPTTAPTTGPATKLAPPDLSTPRSAVLAWLSAGSKADLERMKEILVDDPAQRELLSDVMGFPIALKRLERAAVARFGDADSNVTGYPPIVERVIEPKITIRGETAVAEIPDATPPVPLNLRRIDGRWRIDTSSALRDPQLQALRQSSRQATEVAIQVAEDVAAGKYRSPEEARAAFTQRRLAAVEPPATGPATQR
jgi:hypothetical protein